MVALSRTYRLPASVLAAFLIAAVTAANGQALNGRPIDWTQDSASNNQDAIGLGYPVPIPQNLELPFDGFRSYESLHLRHQDLMLTTDWVHGEIVGRTRADREIWAYRIGDNDLTTVDGLPEPAMMIQGGIHAREWQSPEVVTGVMELLVDEADDNHLYRYLLDNVNLAMLPVHNIDGFLQTQRYPSQSYLGGDPGSPQGAPRDGRMRRKNMLDVDELFDTRQDHLLGVDLNRNNPPFWASSGGSSGNVNSLVHHGGGPHSETEAQAMVATSQLGPQDRLRMYSDVHSFSQVFFSRYTDNSRRNRIQDRLLQNFSNHHAAFPLAKRYVDDPSGPGVGIGATDEYFAETFQIPSFTLEIEPSGGGSTHPTLPGCGADYGGFAENCHDGFVLPESQIRRVREQLAQSFAVAYYQQAGPPALIQLRLVDDLTGSVVVDLEWDVISPSQRQLYRNVVQAIQAERDYTLWLAFNKPMRWRSDAGEIGALSGQPSTGLSVQLEQLIDGAAIEAAGEPSWLNQNGVSTDHYRRYQDDALAIPVRFSANQISSDGDIALQLNVADMVGQQLDSNPATTVDWANGNWVAYEDETGLAGDVGGSDEQFQYPVTAQALDDPFIIEPGVSAAWFDTERSGEGFVVEVLDDDRAVVYWFTYDDNGQSRWLTGIGEINGNQLSIPEFMEPTTGSPFGANFNADDIVLSSTGSSDLVFTDCDSASAGFAEDGQRKLRHNLVRLSTLNGLPCGETVAASSDDAISGSWFDPANSGQGFVVQRIEADRALVFWFTYNDTGAPYWILGDGSVSGDTLQIDQALNFSGPRFGQAFDPADGQSQDWGQLTMRFSCTTANAEFTSNLPEFGSGTVQLSRLTQLAGLDCNQ